jgi:hypothetical protein
MTVLSPARRACYSPIPAWTRGEVVRFLVYGIPTGGYLMAVLSNDLKATFAQGDDENLEGLKGLMTWLHSFAPAIAKGSEKAYIAWLGREDKIGLLESAMGLKEGLEIFAALGDAEARKAIETIWGVRIEE